MSITFNAWTTPIVFTYDASTNTYVNRSGSTAFDYFPDDCAVGDILYIGLNFYTSPLRSEKFRNIQVNVGTARDGTVTFAYEYYKYGSTWTALSVTDNTNGFQNLGQNTITFTPPGDWRRTTINSSNQHWIRIRVTASSGVTEGGANQTQYVQVGDNIIQATAGESMAAIYSADVAGSWGVVTNLGNYYKIDTGNIFISGGSSLNLTDLYIEVATNWRFYILGTATTLNRTHIRTETTHAECIGTGWAGGYDREKYQFWSNGGSMQDSTFEFTAGYNTSYEIRSNATWTSCSFVGGEIGHLAHYGNPSHYYCNYRAGSGNIIFGTAFTAQYGGVFFGGDIWGKIVDSVIDNAIIATISKLEVYQCSMTLNNPIFIDKTYTVDMSHSGRTISIYYDVNMLVQDYDGDPVASATITIKDKDGTEVFSDTTDVDGKADTTLLTKYSTYPSTETNYNPFDITVEKDAYYPLVVSDIYITREFDPDNPLVLTKKVEEPSVKKASAGIINYTN